MSTPAPAASDERPVSKTEKLRLNAEAAVKALFDHTELCPEAGDDLLKVTLDCCEKLGIYLADFPDMADHWDQKHDHLPTIASRNPLSRSTGFDVLHRKFGGEEKPKSRKRSSRVVRPVFAGSVLLKVILTRRIKDELKKQQQVGSSKLKPGEWAKQLATEIETKYAWCLRAPHPDDRGADVWPPPSAFYSLIRAKKLSHEKPGKKINDSTAFTQVIREKVVQILKEIDCDDPPPKDEAAQFS